MKSKFYSILFLQPGFHYLLNMSFSIERESLSKIAGKYETRTFAEEVDLLEERGENLDWMLSALGTDKNKGIQDSE